MNWVKTKSKKTEEIRVRNKPKRELEGYLDCKENWFCDDDVHDGYNNQDVEQVGTSWFIYNRKCQVLNEKKEINMQSVLGVIKKKDVL